MSIVEEISDIFNSISKDDINKLNQIEEKLSKIIYILTIIKEKIENFLEKQKSKLDYIRNYLYSSIKNKINEKDFYKLQEIISSFQLNDEYEKKLKELDDAVKKFLGVQNNENNWPDNKNKNDKFFQLNDKILVIATQYSIILKDNYLKNNIKNNVYTFSDEIKYCCGYDYNEILVSVKENNSYILKKINIKRLENKDLYKSDNEITFISKSNFSNKIYFVEKQNKICIYENNKVSKISLKMNIHSFKEITEKIFFFVSYNSWCFYNINDNKGKEITKDQYYGNIFNPEDIVILKKLFLILGSKKYFFVFNKNDYKLKIKIKITNGLIYSCICPSYDGEYLCIYMNNTIVIYDLKENENKQLNLKPLIMKKYDFQVYSLIYNSNNQLLLYKGNQEYESKIIK